MLQEIYQYAIDNNLISEEELKTNKNYTSKDISAYIILNKAGEYCGIEKTKTKKKDKYYKNCPDIGTLQFNANANPIVEKVKFIFDKEQEKHNSFIKIMTDISINSPIIKTINIFIDDIENDLKKLNSIKKDLDNLNISSEEKISFKVEGVSAEDDNTWKSTFNEIMSRNGTSSQIKFPSSITGSSIIPLQGKVSPIIKEPSQILQTGCYIASFGKESFQSYGCKGNLNALIGEEEATIIKIALEKLLSSNNNFDKNFGIIHFYDSNQEMYSLKDLLDADDDFYEVENDFVEQSNNEIAKEKDYILKENYLTPFSGQTVNLEINNNIFHIFEFKIPEKGRFLISKYKKGTCKELHENIIQWRNDTRLIKNFHNKTTYKTITKIYNIFLSLIENKKGTKSKYEKINDEFGSTKTELLYSIIDNTQIPLRIYQKAIKSYKHCFYETTKNEKEKNDIEETMFISLQVIKAYLIRKQKKEGKVITIMPELNIKEDNIAYNCGRLFAIYEQIQFEAQGNLNVSIANNYFSSAQSTPHLVFGRLSKLSNYHLNKIEKEPIKIFWKKKLLEITNNIQAFPKTFNIEEQGMFALGYYHQQSNIFRINNEKENKNE